MNDSKIHSSRLVELARERMTGVIVNVYRSGLGDSTMGGVTSPARSEGKAFVVLDEAIEHGNYSLKGGGGGWFSDPDYVALRLVRRTISGREYIHAEPFEKADGHRMFGGNFVYTSDSRLRAICDYPIPVHDRVER